MLLLMVFLVIQAPGVPMRCGTGVFAALRPVAGVALPAVKSPADPPEPGDSQPFWLQNMGVMPPVQVQKSVTCRGIGDHCYVMVEDSAWDAGQVDSADVARIIERFDRTSPRDSTRGVWDHNTSVLGQPPDAIDDDSLVYLVYYDIGTYHGNSFDGFWQYFDEYYDTTSMRRWGYHSNEVECVYLDCYPENPSTDYRVAIAAHEFGHMIHWNYDQAESLWVNEGCCELAMWLFGSPDPISSFPSSPDNDLTKWEGDWADYIKTYLFFLYLYEQYGGRVGTALVQNIIASPAKSIAGIDEGFAETGLAERFEEVFDGWVLANRIDDTAFLGGRYGYYGEDVPYFAVAGFHTTYPVTRSGSLARWAGEYVLFQRGSALELGFDGADDGDFHVFVVGLDTVNHRLLLDTMALDSVQHGTHSVPGFDTAWQSVFLVPANHDPAGTRSYQYEAQVAGIAEDPGNAPRGTPAATVVRGVLRVGSPLTADGRPPELLDALGRRVTDLVPGENDVSGLAPGVYFITGEGPRVQGSEGSRVEKVVIQH